MAESIDVVYEPLGSVMGKTYYHETVVYTDSDGVKHIATAYPTGSGGLGALSKGSSSDGKDSSNSFGTLDAKTGKASDFEPAWANKLLGPDDNPNPSSNVAKGDDLSKQWQSIEKAYGEVKDGNYTYSPLTQNSNSTASTALKAAGLTPPTDTGLTDDHWSPASGKTLDIPSVQKNDASSQSGDGGVDKPTDAGANESLPGGIAGGAGAPEMGGGPLLVVSNTNKIMCTGCPGSMLPLIVTSQFDVFGHDQLSATIADCKPIVNIPVFGPCLFTPAPPSPSGGPCVPKPVGPWAPGSVFTYIHDIPALRQTDVLICGSGGLISVIDPGQYDIMVK